MEARWSGIGLHPFLVGRFPVEPGSTWEILQPKESDTPILQQGYNSLCCGAHINISNYYDISRLILEFKYYGIIQFL